MPLRGKPHDSRQGLLCVCVSNAVSVCDAVCVCDAVSLCDAVCVGSAVCVPEGEPSMASNTSCFTTTMRLAPNGLDQSNTQ
jgi:hypothetical protein